MLGAYKGFSITPFDSFCPYTWACYGTYTTHRCIRPTSSLLSTKSISKAVLNDILSFSIIDWIEVGAGDNFISNLNENSIMGDDENEHERPRKADRRGMNYFGLFLLFSSSSVIFTPLLENFPSIAPNGWEILIWLAWGYAIFAYSIILLIVNNVFRFLENQRVNLSTSPPNRNWLKHLKTLGVSLLLWFALIIILWNIPV